MSIYDDVWSTYLFIYFIETGNDFKEMRYLVAGTASLVVMKRMQRLPLLLEKQVRITCISPSIRIINYICFP